MPQIAQTISSVAVNESTTGGEAKNSNYSAQENSCDHQQLNSVMSDLNRLSRSFVDSYQNLEGHVEQLNGQLQNASDQRSEDIEEKQKLIDEKHAINNRLQNLLAILPSGVVVLDGKGVVRDCNTVATDILGRPLLGEPWLDVISRTFQPQADDGHQISLRDGRKVHIETRALDSEPGQLIVITDMTKTRKLQAELSQQQKLSSMGKMVASLAHQIRTPLSTAILYGSHIVGTKLPSNKREEFSGLLLERLKFMDRQISDMLNFVKGERKTKSVISVNDLLLAIEMNCTTLKHEVIFKAQQKELPCGHLSLDIDTMIGAITNLIDNAIDATSDSSPIKVNCSIVNDDCLVIEVKDCGKGIKIKHQKDLFEPFYTTKSHGNGLGLAIVHGVIIDHQGTISVDSTYGEGSCFKVELPIIRRFNSTDGKPQFVKKTSNLNSSGAAYGH